MKNTMSIISVIAIAAILLVGCNGRSHDSSSGIEDSVNVLQHRHECWGSANPSNVEVCAVNFAQVANDPGSFDGSYVKIIGYAVAADGYTYLYPSKDQFIYSAARGGIEISLTGEAKAMFEELAERNQHGTAVVGQFHAWRGRLRGSVGSISGDNIIFFEQRPPWEPPPPPPPKSVIESDSLADDP